MLYLDALSTQEAKRANKSAAARGNETVSPDQKRGKGLLVAYCAERASQINSRNWGEFTIGRMTFWRDTGRKLKRDELA
jgi:hypothetical protein